MNAGPLIVHAARLDAHRQRSAAELVNATVDLTDRTGPRPKGARAGAMRRQAFQVVTTGSGQSRGRRCKSSGAPRPVKTGR
ncbi:hypothetical protein [Kitasatospora indigofera]|uniref:hypothetical protein n=1 Tax=Kitasatospora indigofera TaxID=67307 RepID=UPI003253D642